jgi:nucleoside-diphosphate-sugar epimerase
MKNKRILITGGAGYIGSVLTTFLLNKKYKVTVIDNLTYKNFPLSHLLANKNFKFINEDVRIKKKLKKILKDFDIIIPLAALVGAPLCEKKKKLATEINLNVIKFIVKNLSFKQQIIFPTTNSGYGIGEISKYCTENSILRPVSHYGKTKMLAEKIVMQHKNFISFRLATVFGCSYRMRTDLLVNNFVYTALKKKTINLFEASFRRNFIHVHDVCRAFYFAILNFRRMKNQVYNLGLSSANINKKDLALKIKKQVKKLKLNFLKNRKDPDKRDYYVSNKKIEKLGFKAVYNLDDGIKELIQYFRLNNHNIKNNY